jgi:hypothetical protein
MTRLGFVARKAIRLCCAGMLGLLFSACGGSSGSGTSSTSTGPDGILNGATLAASTSHWVSTQCHVQAELSSDNGFWSVVVNSVGTTYSGSEKWTLGPNPNSVTVGPGFGGVQGALWISALGDITGSVSSEAFTANVTVETGSTSQSLGGCTFVLAPGNLA